MSEKPSESAENVDTLKRIREQMTKTIDFFEHQDPDAGIENPEAREAFKELCNEAGLTDTWAERLYLFAKNQGEFSALHLQEQVARNNRRQAAGLAPEPLHGINWAKDVDRMMKRVTAEATVTETPGKKKGKDKDHKDKHHHGAHAHKHAPHFSTAKFQREKDSQKYIAKLGNSFSAMAMRQLNPDLFTGGHAHAAADHAQADAGHDKAHPEKPAGEKKEEKKDEKKDDKKDKKPADAHPEKAHK